MADEATTGTATAEAAPAKEPADANKYVRVERSNRVTKATVGIYDAEHEDNTVFDKANGRWAVFCVTHNTLRQVKALSAAWKLHAAPWEFCAGCAEIQAKRVTAEPAPKKAATAKAGPARTVSGQPERPVARPPDEGAA